MHVLLVEDSVIDAQALRDLLDGLRETVTLTHASDLANLERHGIPAGVDIVLLDLTLPDAEGTAAITRVQTLMPDIPVVILTADDDPTRSLEMVRRGAQDYLIKGQITRDGLWRALCYAVERQELKRRLSRADRLAGVGQLAAGVAHEVANPTTWVLGKLEMLKRQLRDGDETTLALLEDSMEGLNRIGRVVRDLQAYARLGDARSELVRLDELVERTCQLVLPSVRHRARLVTDLEAMPPIAADRSKLEQLVTNLLLNAAQAIEEGDPGGNRITVRTHRVEQKLHLDVEDTGCGIPDDVRERVFEPFFTTKPRDEGTGLGLAISAEIVRQHRGSIRCESAAGGGTRVEVRLPLLTGLEAQHADGAAEARAPAGRARILLLDDEPQLREIYRALLEDHHDLVLASGGREGLALLDQHGASSFDVILCDLMMPDLDGQAFYEQVAAAHPEIRDRIVFCSGGVVTERARQFMRSIDNRLLHKPVTMAALLETIEAVRSS